ncbi:stabilin-1 isoform X2 [Hyperolius riggenbachi]|uniref:stabilin-1 isoform X2 n=1 Tax=Hyperolius riggenbachi TaxID=752182 RepID=UPI0035A2CD00
MSYCGYRLILLVACVGLAATQKPPKRCDVKKAVRAESECMSCAAALKYICPKGSTRFTAGSGNEGCRYTVDLGGVVLSLQGCSHLCQTTVTQPVCCKGFWGTDCSECPGGAKQPCGGHGVCQDGLTGNGTCVCDEGFAGFACGECSDPSLYGASCTSACSCKHGVCKSGVSGDGSCICEAGYMGPACELESLSCKALSCGENSRCAPSLQGPTCQCMPGYSRKNNACIPLDPCKPSPCHGFASCKNLGPRQYKCTCNTGYYGDGKMCLPINPCSVNNGGCFENSTRCVFRSAGKSYCSCLPGMVARNASAGCYTPYQCRQFACGNTAHCQVVPPGGAKCVCMEGEISDGRNCYGNLLYAIQKIRTDFIPMKEKPGALRIFEDGCGLALRKSGPFTVFVPVMKTTKVNETAARHKCKGHMVVGQFMEKDLYSAGKLWTMNGGMLNFANGKISKTSEPEKTYKIVRANLPAANGIIHVIDKPFTDDSAEAIGTQQMTIGDILAQTERFSRFETLLENCDLPPILNGHGSFTVFAPSNDAVDSLRDGRLIHLLTTAKHKLLDLVKNHISSVAAVTLDRLITMPHIMTASNEMIKINVTENGRILFGNPGVPITRSDIIASNGVIHVLDGILIPPNILPILPSNCDEKVDEVYEEIIDCNLGGSDNSRTGCAFKCGRSVNVTGCCSGFYGPECRACPGGFTNPCYGRGSCNDGRQGNGKCVCYPKYKGIACHICSDPNKHGDECEEDCRCAHGVCDNRPGSRGVCQGGRCKDGYTGQFCDQRSEPCGPLNITQFCHINAVCVSTENSTSCQCENGYEGDGTVCQLMDECKKPERGGCSENAICTSSPPGISCQCNPGWTGDGIECIAVDNCASESKGGCHADADCSFTQPGEHDCTCKSGYAGDGYTCDPVNVCLENNGDCDEKATCTAVSGGVRTCTCHEGFAGDGLTCYGDVMMELQRLSESDSFRKWITKANFEIPSGVNVTLFVPSSEAVSSVPLEKSSIYLNSSNSYMLPFIIRGHILRESYSSDWLSAHTEQELDTLDPRTKLVMTVTEGKLKVNGVNVSDEEIPATNGKIFIISQVLFPPLGNIPPPRPGLLQTLSQQGAWDQFKLEIQNSSVIQEMEALQQKYTVFVPDNAAIKTFLNQSGTDHLDPSIIKYHIIQGEALSPADLRNGMHRSSMLGSSYWLMFFKRYNQTLVQDTPLDGRFYKTDNGMLMGITKVLRILNNRCDMSEVVVKKARCSNCDRGIPCPDNSVLNEPLGAGSGNCTYRRRGKQIPGCRFSCVLKQVVEQCCAGFYGHQCLPCPGGVTNVCANNGKCQDGIAGSGECICEEGFHGTACETCEAGRYGAECKSECDCVHGKCNDGLHGDGFCQCDKGWTGSTCEIDILSDLCNGSCSIFANCVPGPTNSTGTCSCLAGFTGNGTHCTEIDACAVNNGGCSEFANCTNASLGQARCTCLDGYSGDGVICLEIDACLENNGGCHAIAECTKTGPNKVACNCLPGYEGNGTDSCTPINICKQNNGGCSPLALCIPTGPLKRNCYCRAFMTGDGITCTGNIAQTLMYDKEGIGFYKLVQKYKMKDLAGSGPFTVFIPLKDVIENQTKGEEQQSESHNNQTMKRFLRYHLMGCRQLLLSDLKDLSSLTALTGDVIRVSTKDGEVYLNDHARIVKSDLVTTNGFIHFIDQVLLSENQTSINSSLLNTNGTLYSLAAYLSQDNRSMSFIPPGYSVFAQLLSDANLFSEIRDQIHWPFTILWPTDEAFSSLSEERRRWLYHEDHSDNLIAYLKVHFIRDTKLSAANLPSAQSLRTLHGSTVSFQCSQTTPGDILINENSARIIYRDMEFFEGIVHSIDQLLEPPNIGARCDGFTSTVAALNLCSVCGLESPCPSGTVDKGETERCSRRTRPFRGDRYRSGRYRVGLWDDIFLDESDRFGSFAYGGIYQSSRRFLRGCARICYKVSWEPRCCKNHYGGDCHVCPGGLESPCSNQGTCVDGMAGTGRCDCAEGFNGTACELCAPNRYGPDCRECTCTENGQCSDGLSGDGSCFCTEGWTGQNCDIKLAREPVCSPECDGNATCRMDNECECDPHYEGDGRTCSLIDQCKTYNGGCSIHALCSQSGIKLSCACLPGYEGDGYVCTPINLCVNGENGGCSEHAECIYTGPNSRRCECHDGYVGNGVQCLEKSIPPVDRCLQNNGDCDALAVCSDLHYEEKTAGVFHLQSPKGKYEFTYEEAEQACEAEGATIATLQQLSAAQQLGYHRCLAGWLYNGSAGYPTVYPSASCGANHVGIVDYKQRTNLSEKRDVYCYRFNDVSCECSEGYVGDGSYCNGNLLEVLEANSKLSTFYSMILDYSNSSSRGAEFVDTLINRTSYKTLFAPEDGSFDSNVTLSWRDLEHHISMLDILLPYSNLTNGTTLLSKTGYNLSFSESLSDCGRPPCPKIVNDKVIVLWDIPAYNGILHVIRGPLMAPLIPEVAESQVSHPVTAGLVTISVIALIAGLAAGFVYYRRNNNGFHFRHFKEDNDDDDDDLDVTNNGNPPTMTIPNPMYGANNAFFEQFEDLYNDGDDSSDSFRILH